MNLVEDEGEKGQDVCEEKTSRMMTVAVRHAILEERLHAWITASKLVDEIIILQDGLEEYRASTGLTTSSTFTKVDQHIDHIMNVANWLLEKE